MTFQLGAALLDACVLATLSQGDTYGYVLTQNIRRAIEVSESTLYPVLRRLQKEGCLTTYDQPYQGRNRRYYAITDYGRAKYDYYLREWQKYKACVDSALKGGISHD
ncbi:PadR family transcriptional regulator [Feifania hominis]|uniref:PadR family transcriptional regulator n=1 Tax=Feifania hominis TaxID=2763660 RepID=A0A926DBN3_9FIRM|nr:PadR family transcriptional regulator [Feifania hominis]MBC8535261.1 PadR family transcriptional regulator [Feifania hominis]